MFDPERLVEIIQELNGQVQSLTKDSQLKNLTQTLRLVNATIISAMPQIMATSVMKQKSGNELVKWRLHALLKSITTPPRGST